MLAADSGYILRLIRSGAAWRRIGALAALSRPVTHADLDELGSAMSMMQIRSLFVDLGILPVRNERLIDLERCTETLVSTLSARANRLAVSRFARWRQQRRRRDRPMTAEVLANDKRELRLIVGLLSDAEACELDVRTMHQPFLDRWLAERAADAGRVRHFIRWCARAGLNVELVPPGYARPDFLLGGAFGETNEAALKVSLQDASIDPRLRLAVLLIVVYGVRVHRIAELAVASLHVSEFDASIRLGTVDLLLPRVAHPWARAITDGIKVKRRLGGANIDHVWIFPGYRHGDHVSPSSLAAKLRTLGVNPTAGHRAASGALITQVPPAVLARVLGVSMATASTWARLAGLQPEGPVLREFG